MAPTKRAAPGAAGIASRCSAVEEAILAASECPDRVRQMLSRTLADTAGTPAADRHPFNERFVAMIEEVLKGEHTRLSQDVASKDSAFTQLAPEKSTRETQLDQNKAAAKEKSEAVEVAKKEVAENAAAIKQAAAKVTEEKKAQKTGDADAHAVADRKAKLESAQASLAPLVDGSGAPDDKAAQVAAVLDAGKNFDFDSSLMTTAAQVLERDASERGGFDATCLEQLKEAFTSGIAKIAEECASHAPAMAQREEAVQTATSALQTLETDRESLRQALAAAKDAKAAADGEQKAAAKSLADFTPELKAAGDALDSSRKALKVFEDAAQTAFNELKEFKEGDFVKKSYFQQIDGMRLDRAVIDTCRESVAPEGQTPGRVSLEDAQKVFAKMADANKVTRAERWTLRYCLQEFQWDENAHDWIVEELTKLPQEDQPAKKARTSGKGYYETIDGCKCDRAIVDVCREGLESPDSAMPGGRLNIEDAKKAWAKAADAKKVTHVEKWTLRHCLSAYKWTREAHDYVLEQLKASA